MSKIFVAGGGVYVGQPDAWAQVQGLPTYFYTRLAGTGESNVFVIGAFGASGHFNGRTWHTYPELMLSNGTYEGLAVFGHTMVAVGQNGSRGIILMGNRVTR